MLLPQLPGDFSASLGTIGPRRSLDAQRTHLAAFFDLHLRGSPTAVFDRQSHPDVRIVP